MAKSTAEPIKVRRVSPNSSYANEIDAPKDDQPVFLWTYQLAHRFGLVSCGCPNTAGNPAASTTAATDTDGQDEYVIRENLLTNTNLPRQMSGPDTIGDVVPQNIKLEPLPPEIMQKVPKAKAHQFFVKDNDTVVLVSPSDRRVADVIKKKSSD